MYFIFYFALYLFFTLGLVFLFCCDQYCRQWCSYCCWLTMPKMKTITNWSTNYSILKIAGIYKMGLNGVHWPRPSKINASILCNRKQVQCAAADTSVWCDLRRYEKHMQCVCFICTCIRLCIVDVCRFCIFGIVSHWDCIWLIYWILVQSSTNNNNNRIGKQVIKMRCVSRLLSAQSGKGAWPKFAKTSICAKNRLNFDIHFWMYNAHVATATYNAGNIELYSVSSENAVINVHATLNEFYRYPQSNWKVHRAYALEIVTV